MYEDAQQKRTIVEEKELSEEDVLEGIEEHLPQVIGPQLYEGRLIQDVYIVSISVSQDVL